MGRLKFDVHTQVDEAERTDKLDARAARDLLRTFDVFVPRSAFAPADDDAARAAVAASA